MLAVFEKYFAKLSDAYVAGLFDGEGCVKLCPYKTKAGIRYQIAVTVSNTEMSLLEPLREVYGGCVRSSGKQISPTHRKALAWEARSRVAAAFLARALPHMRSPMKIHRAKVTLEPFERGYGHTLGNALRRVLLSSMVGYAPTEVTIAGVLHDVVEDCDVPTEEIDRLFGKEVGFLVDGPIVVLESLLASYIGKQLSADRA